MRPSPSNPAWHWPHFEHPLCGEVTDRERLGLPDRFVSGRFEAALARGHAELRRASTDGKAWIATLQQKEIERTRIASLKVRFNSVFGYYIEITKSNLDKVPPHYIRKQTIANGERFITPELKDMEGKILGAEERNVKLEYELFQRVREAVLGQLKQIQQTAAALAQLDVLRAPVGSIIEALDALASMTADFRVNYANLINTALSNEV